MDVRELGMAFDKLSGQICKRGFGFGIPISEGTSVKNLKQEIKSRRKGLATDYSVDVFRSEFTPIFRASTVLVCANVANVLEKLIEQVFIGAVDFDAVEAGLVHRILRSCCIHFFVFMDLRDRLKAAADEFSCRDADEVKCRMPKRRAKMDLRHLAQMVALRVPGPRAEDI
ncbi:hypothetical protein B0H19DRAFT_1258894 [Mycena capillaripes]|nr:hypothetical protein B0H19DRAFT_1258894 [Mycena capillaripes]